MSNTKACHCCEGTGKEINHVVFGKEMRTLREKRGLTQDEVCKRMGISKSYVSEMERGTRHWTEERAKRYKKALV